MLNQEPRDVVQTKRMQEYFTKTEFVLGLLLSVYVVVFLWGFFTKGSVALGFNATIFYLLFFVYFFLGIKNWKEYCLKNMYFLIPFLSIIMSFSLYENPYLKTINALLFPVVLILFIGISLTKFPKSNNWTLKLLDDIIARGLPLLTLNTYIKQRKNQFQGNSKTVNSILKGVGGLIAINIVIVGLLISADTNFADLVKGLFGDFDISVIFRIGFILVCLVIFYALKIRWKTKHIVEQEEKMKNIDTLVASITLLGTLFVYFVFIVVQMRTLFDFSGISGNVEIISSAAKRGFWQLFFVSLINIALFYRFFTKKYTSLRIYLGLFLGSSFVILLSAGMRMWNYISDFGLSYEKFTASYTLLFFGILFISLFVILLGNLRKDIFKFGIVLCLWMYGFLNILPMEKIIFQFNTKVSLEQFNNKNYTVDLVEQREVSPFYENQEDYWEKRLNRISPYQSHILSYDIYESVKHLETQKPDLFEIQGWKEWLEKQDEIYSQKRWFEMNLSNFNQKK